MTGQEQEFQSMQCHACFSLYGWHCRFLSWDDYFMAVAFLSSQRSKDPNKQVTCSCPLCHLGIYGVHLTGRIFCSIKFNE